MGGKNENDNIITLLPQEHYYAHKLLADENPHNNKLQYALWLMVSIKDRRSKHLTISANEYAEARERFVNILSCEGSYNKKPRSQDFKDKISKAKLSQHRHFYNNGIKEMCIKENDEVPEGFVKGRLPDSEETRLKRSNAMKGRTPNNKGKRMSEAQRKQISQTRKAKTRSLHSENKASAHNATPVVEVTTNAEYYSLENASERTGISIYYIKKSINKSLAIDGLMFRLKTKEENFGHNFISIG